MDQVKARLESERADLPVGKNGRDDEDLIMWFLRDRKFDVDAAVEKFNKTLVNSYCGFVFERHVEQNNLNSDVYSLSKGSVQLRPECVQQRASLNEINPKPTNVHTRATTSNATATYTAREISTNKSSAEFIKKM